MSEYADVVFITRVTIGSELLLACFIDTFIRVRRLWRATSNYQGTQD